MNEEPSGVVYTKKPSNIISAPHGDTRKKRKTVRHLASSQSQMMVVEEKKLPEARTISVLFSIVSNDIAQCLVCDV